MNRLQLFHGDSLILSDSLEVKHPKLIDIVDDYDRYQTYLSVMVSTSLDVADLLWVDSQIWYEDIKNEWKFFVQKSISQYSKPIAVAVVDNGRLIKVEANCIAIDELYANSLNYFLDTNGKWIVLSSKNGETEQTFLVNTKQDGDMYYIDENCVKFTEHFYHLTTEFLESINWTKREHSFLKGGTKRAKKYILENDYKKRNRPHKKPNIDIESICSLLVMNGMDYDKIWDLPIFAFYSCYYRLSKMDEYKNTIQALYGGCIDTEKNPINWDKINWASVINL